MEILEYVNENPVMPFIIFAFLISVVLLFITKRSEDPPEIIIPNNLTVHKLIAFLIKISLERPKGLAILTLVVLFMVVATGTALSTYADYIKNTQKVSGNLIKKVEDLATNQKTLTEMVGTLSENIKNRNTHPRLLSKLVNENIELLRILDNFKNDAKASRVSILEFHNGSQTFSGMPFGKVSVTQEVVAYGVSKEINHLQSVPIREFIAILPDMIANKVSVYSKSNPDHQVGLVLGDLLMTRGTGSAMFVPLFVPYSYEPIGLVLLEWTTEFPMDIKTRDRIKYNVNRRIKTKLVSLVTDINTPHQEKK